MELPRIIVTTGDPAGIGPDIIVKAATTTLDAHLVAIGDRNVLQSRAKLIGIDLKIVDYEEPPQLANKRSKILPVIHRRCTDKVVAGVLHPRHSEYSVNCIDAAVDLCINGQFDAMVTGPVNKAIINQAGIQFYGHTEWIANRCNVQFQREYCPVMMLASANLRVCLLTNHIALSAVASQVTASRLRKVSQVILHDLWRLFAIKQPRLGVCGLNPHAGESGYIGHEEVAVITPTLDELRAQGAKVIGPISADTAFTPTRLATMDAVLVMYHDQGLPVIKHAGFGNIVNLTLGLPIVRTSVDHGTAAELAGTRRVCESSLHTAITVAVKLSTNKKSNSPQCD